MTEPELHIRPADISDIKAIMALEEGSIAHPWTSEEIGTLITDPRKKCLVAVLDGKVVCYAGSETVLDECNIGNLVTDKEYRGRGFASVLMNALLEDLKDNGIKKVFLEVEHDNLPALSLYEKLGFARYGQRRGYYGAGRDAVLMRKEL